MRLVPFRVAQIGKTTGFYSPQLVSHPSPRLFMALPMFQLVNCTRCPTGSCLSQSHPLPARLGPHWPCPYAGRPSEDQGLEVMGWGFSWSCPQMLHTTTLPRYCECGVMVALAYCVLVKKQRELKPPIGHVSPRPTRRARRWRFHVASGGRRGPAIRSAGSAVRMT